jgi:hypothetical protein
VLKDAGVPMFDVALLKMASKIQSSIEVRIILPFLGSMKLDILV